MGRKRDTPPIVRFGSTPGIRLMRRMGGKRRSSDRALPRRPSKFDLFPLLSSHADPLHTKPGPGRIYCFADFPLICFLDGRFLSGSRYALLPGCGGGRTGRGQRDSERRSNEQPGGRRVTHYNPPQIRNGDEKNLDGRKAARPGHHQCSGRQATAVSCILSEKLTVPALPNCRSGNALARKKRRPDPLD